MTTEPGGGRPAGDELIQTLEFSHPCGERCGLVVQIDPHNFNHVVGISVVDDYDVELEELRREIETGDLPLEIQALPEGTIVPRGVPLVQVVNTDDELPWLTSFIETPLLRATEEAGYLVSGLFDIEIDGHWFSLQPGDSFRFASKPFRWKNPGDEDAVVIWVIAPPVY